MFFIVNVFLRIVVAVYVYACDRRRRRQHYCLYYWPIECPTGVDRGVNIASLLVRDERSNHAWMSIEIMLF